jgi:hypothetical protein
MSIAEVRGPAGVGFVCVGMLIVGGGGDSWLLLGWLTVIVGLLLLLAPALFGRY